MPTEKTTIPYEVGADLIAVLDAADDQPGAVRLRRRSYDLLDLRPGEVAVDVGCGTGRAVAELTEQGVTAIGVDPDELMLGTAHRRWPRADFRAGSAQSLPLPDGAVTGYRAEKVFHVLADPGTALAEARRVLAPAGRIVLLGQDWDALIIDSDHPELTRAVLRAQADTCPRPQAARAYRNLLLDAGFQDVAVEAYLATVTDAGMLPVVERFGATAVAADAVTPAQHARWADDQRRRARDGRLFLAFPMFLASARRP